MSVGSDIHEGHALVDAEDECLVDQYTGMLLADPEIKAAGIPRFFGNGG
jgi:hypothetical protein